MVPPGLMLEGVDHLDEEKPAQHLTSSHHGAQQQKAPPIGSHILKVSRDRELKELFRNENDPRAEHEVFNRVDLMRGPSLKP
eukprot:4550337-Prorocentrum_lima.AAC.1